MRHYLPKCLSHLRHTRIHSYTDMNLCEVLEWRKGRFWGWGWLAHPIAKVEYALRIGRAGGRALSTLFRGGFHLAPHGTSMARLSWWSVDFIAARSFKWRALPTTFLCFFLRAVSNPSIIIELCLIDYRSTIAGSFKKNSKNKNVKIRKLWRLEKQK